MNKKKQILFHIVMPIIIGVIIYLIWSPNVYFTVFFWELLPIDNPFIDLEISEMPFIIRMIRYYLCDILWMYALTYSILLIIEEKEKKSILLGCVISAIFGTLIELSQLFDFVAGSFDYFDILIQIITSFFTGIIYCKQ